MVGERRDRVCRALHGIRVRAAGSPAAPGAPDGPGREVHRESRVPGLGARAVDKIIATRRHTALRLDDIARLSPGLKRALPFLIAADHSPARLTDRSDLRARLTKPSRQMSLFA